jgi:hypothetical protein
MATTKPSINKDSNFLDEGLLPPQKLPFFAGGAKRENLRVAHLICRLKSSSSTSSSFRTARANTKSRGCS